MASCTNFVSDASDPATDNVLLFLACINLLVIAQGFYSFWVVYKATKESGLQRVSSRVIAFYGLALSCLLVAEIYFFSGLATFNTCF